MVSQILIINNTDLEVPQSFVQKIAELFLGFLEKKNITKDLCEVKFSIVFVNDEEIRRLNKSYRNKDIPTDVLSFCTGDGGMLSEQSKDSSNGPIDLGDIVLCDSVIKDNSMRLRVDENEELARVIVHGVLHLFGFDHEVPLEENVKSKMLRIQEKFLKDIKKEGVI